MSTEARMQPDTFERLRSALGDTSSWNHDFLAEYVNVTELNSHRREEDVFRRLAFRCANPSAADAEACAALYEGMGPEHRAELRRWWHEKIRRQAYQYRDLGTRLSWRYLV